MQGFEKPTRKQHAYPVIECFGPTIQGEGALFGQPVHFVRFGGCDYRCEWCDSKYAVEPDLVREHAVKMSPAEIVAELDGFTGRPEWVVLSGGNPALHELGPLVVELHDAGYKVTVETQGTVFREWLNYVDHLTVSPKPPSSGMFQKPNDLRAFLGRLDDDLWTAVKIVVFDNQDYRFARSVFEDLAIAGYPQYEHEGGNFFLSVGNHVGDDGTEDLLRRWKWLVEKTAADEQMGDVRIMPQGHVLLYGNARGV